MTSTARIRTEPKHTRQVVLCLLAPTVAPLGLAWAKWVPYTDRIGGIAGSGTYPGKSMLASTAGGGAFGRAATFTLAYTEAVWKALVVALLISACVDVLVPRS